MDRETNRIRSSRQTAPALDNKDRTLLGLLGRDATLSYAELGKTDRAFRACGS